MIDNIYLTALITLIGSAVLVIYLIPKIIWIVTSRDLADRPGHRSAHKISTPSMAGVAFFLTSILALFFIKTWDVDMVGINLTAALTLMFAIGLKDDLVISTPRAKIGGELIAISFILFCNCIQVSSLDGFLGIQNIPSVISYALIIIMILTIINSYNLIDGIDGLASVIGIVIFGVYGLIFFIADLHFYFLLCTCLLGMHLAFLRYNWSITKKIFMGDTGSLIMGFCIGFLSLKFLSMDISLLNEFSFKAENKFFVIAAILYIPLFDTIRVIGIRLLNKKSPFFPDNNHIHHVLIDSGLKHYKASLFLGLLNLGLALIFIFLSSYFTSFQMFVFLIISFILLLGVFYQLKSNIESKNKFRYLVKFIHLLF